MSRPRSSDGVVEGEAESANEVQRVVSDLTNYKKRGIFAQTVNSAPYQQPKAVERLDADAEPLK